MVFEYKETTNNADFIIDLLELALWNSLMNIFNKNLKNNGDKSCSDFSKLIFGKTGKKSARKTKTTVKWPVRTIQKIH